MSFDADSHAPVPVPAPGERQLGGYEVLAALKSGGMGDVLLARRVGAHGFEKLVAIKTMRAEFRDRQDARKMFFDEAQLLARLDHPAIAQVYDFGEDGDELFLAMEYVEGVRFSRLAALDAPPAICVQAMAEVLRGLHAVHELTDLGGQPLNVVHRDITPENLMMTFAGRVKVLDFGIALVRGRQAPVTELGTIKGKPPYLSPEQIKSEPIDRRTDIFSAAIVLHEMLTGEPLFTGDSVYAIARKIELEDAPPPSAKAGALPGDLDAVVLRGLTRDRDQRYATAEAFACELDRVAHAIGGERIESYAGRELAAAREDHRARLHELLASVESRMAAGPMYGRPSGVMTAPADPTASADADAKADADEVRQGNAGDDANALAANATSESSEPVHARSSRASSDQRQKSDGQTSSTDTRRRRKWLAIALGALFLGAIGMGVAWRAGPEVASSTSLDGPAAVAAPSATVTASSAPTSAARDEQPGPPAPELAAASTTTDAPGAGDRGDSGGRDDDSGDNRSEGGTRDESAADNGIEKQKPAREADRVGNRRRGKSRRQNAPQKPANAVSARNDEVTKTAPVPAKPPRPEPVEYGFLTVGAEPYALVRLDGKEIGVTPIFRRRVSAGAHQVTLASPDTGAVRLKKTVTVEAEKTATVMLR